MVKSQDAFHIHSVRSIVVGYVMIIKCIWSWGRGKNIHTPFGESWGASHMSGKFQPAPLKCQYGFSCIWIPRLAPFVWHLHGRTCEPDVDSEWHWGHSSNNYWKALWFLFNETFIFVKWCKRSCIHFSVNEGSLGNWAAAHSVRKASR